MTGDVRTGPGTLSAAPERRLVIYALSQATRTIDDCVLHALDALRAVAERLVVVLPDAMVPENASAVRAVADELLHAPHDTFSPQTYRWAIGQESSPRDFDDVVLTGDAWFGPVSDLGAAVERAAAETAPVRAMVEMSLKLPEAFPDAGYPYRPQTWTWTALRRDVVVSPAWDSYWAPVEHAGAGISEERAFLDRLAAAGHAVSFVYPATDYPSADPAIYTPLELIDDGYPFLGLALFTLYPPLLDRFAVIGREIIDGVIARGYPADVLWQRLVRTTPPKGLYAIAGAVEVLPSPTQAYDPAKPPRIAAIVHVGDEDAVPALLDRLEHLPAPYDLYLTTTDGRRAARLQALLEARADARRSTSDIRVTPTSRGRDMSDFFVGCRDVLLDDDVDLVIKVHTRRMRRKTTNVQRYFRRYQFENLLDSPEHVESILSFFQTDDRLGFVFPPMMHIGYNTMGSGWAGLEGKAAELSEELGISVPQDSISPLAPYGGMFVARPAALRLLSETRWRYRDYGRKGAARYQHLAHLQERMLVSAGAELGYRARTVLTAEHASIAHTALESKTDYLFSTTRGWPVEQISLMQRAGRTGHGGLVGLARMYVRLNHPRASRVLMPVFDVALRTILTLRLARDNARAILAALLGRPWNAEK